jgi:thioesterase domain-containing protein/acyl carrier protein
MYWLSQLDGDVPALELPIDHPHPLHSTPDGDYVDIKIPPELYASLQELCRREGVTLFAVVLTTFTTLLHRHSGQRDMLVCSPMAARDRTEFSNLIGYFNNTILLRADLTKARTLVELLHQSQILVMNALTHQTFPFREVSSFPSLARTPLSRGMVAVLEATETPLNLPALDIERVHVFSNAVQYDLSVEMSVFPNRLKGRLMYRTVLFERSTAEKLTVEFGTILEELVTNGNHLILQDAPVHQSHKQDVRQVEKPSHHLPQTDLERRLVHIWCEVLNMDDVGIHDGFFELGGNSLLALQLFTRIEQETGTNLPLSTLFGTTTISHLAKLIEQESARPAWDVLVPIQPNGSRLPFFAIHGVEGGVLGYRDLARALGDDHPFLGLQAVNQDGLQAYDVSVEAIAAHYIDVMRAAQPQGPYRIGGYCFGGVVAYEMARQLEKIGEKVSVLAILEGSMPESKVLRATMLQRLRAIWKSLPAWIGDYSGMTPRQLLNRLRSTFYKIWSKIRRNPDAERRMRVEETLDRIDVDSLPSHHIKLTDAFMNASGRYTPGVYNGEVLLFRARTRGINEVLFGSLDEHMGWSRLAKGGVNVRLVDGFHRNMHLAPYASSLASELRKFLDDETRAGGSPGV